MLFLQYGMRSLFGRLGANALTMFAIAVFVAAASLGVSFYQGMNRMLIDTAPPENIVVVAKSAPSEGASVLALETARKLLVLDGVKIGAREIVTSAYVGDAEEPTPLRGFDEQSPAVHHIRLEQGAMPAPGTLELVVGKAVAQSHPELALGGQIRLPGGPARVVGIFGADGSPLEREIWTPRSAAELHLKAPITSSVTLVAADVRRVPELVARINDSKDLNAHAATVAEFRDKVFEVSSVARIVLILLIALSLIAVSAIATTMTAAAAVRMPELAAMAAIGIHRRILGRVVLMESIMLALVGAALGIGIAAAVRAKLGSLTLGTNAVEISQGVTVVLIGVGLGIVVGVLGGMWPSRTVRRLDILHSLR